MVKCRLNGVNVKFWLKHNEDSGGLECWKWFINVDFIRIDIGMEIDEGERSYIFKIFVYHKEYSSCEVGKGIIEETMRRKGFTQNSLSCFNHTISRRNDSVIRQRRKVCLDIVLRGRLNLLRRSSATTI